MSAIPKVVALFETSLASKISSSAVSATFTSATDEAGNALSGLYGIIVDEGGANQEFMLGTISAKVLTITKRGLDPSTWSTEVSALMFEHRRGASVKITNYPILGVMRNILNGDEELPNFLKYASTVTAWAYGTRQLVTWDKAKDYIDSVAIAGVANADEITKGAVEEATTAEGLAGTDAGGTGAALFVRPSHIAKNIQNSVYNYVLAPTVYVPAFLTGDTGAQATVGTWAAVTNGSFRITINGTAYNCDAINFTGVATMAAVATKIQDKIRAMTSGLETVVWDTNKFIISSVDTGYTSAITVTSTSTGTVGTDISGAGASDWMDCDTGNGVVTAATFAGYAITLVPAVTAYVAGQMFIFKSSAQNIGAATLNVNGLGAKSIKKNNNMALEDGDIEVGSIITVVYDGTNLQMLNTCATMPTSAILAEMNTFFGATDITGAEAEILTGGVNTDADTLHTHDMFLGVGGKLVKTYYHNMIPFLHSSGTFVVGNWSKINTIDGGSGNFVTATFSNSVLQTWGVSALVGYGATFSKDIITEHAISFNVGATGNTQSWGLGNAAYTYNGAADRAINFAVTGGGANAKLYVHTSGGGGGADHTELEITGITTSNMNMYRIEWISGTSAKFYVNGILKATLTTTLPSAGTANYIIGTAGGGAGYGTSASVTTFFAKVEI